MANQPKKYKKFVATAATATLVASAIVPVASAADSKFSDMSNYDAETIALVEDLAAKGIVSGDGNLFKPQGEVSRKHAVLMIGRFLKENGVKGSGEAKQFDDVSSADAEFAELALLVRDLGIFEGNGGKLNPSAKLSRENMALVMDRVFKQITGKTMVETAKDKGLTGEFTDAASIKEEARAAALAAKALGLSKADAFNPKGSAKRVHFAQFFYVALPTLEAALNTPETVEEAAKAVEEAVKALPAEVKADDVEAAKKAVEAANKAIAALEKLAGEDASDEVKAAIKAAKEAVAKTEAAIKAAEEGTVATAITSVNAVNKTKVEVKFNNAIDAATAANFSIEGASVTAATLSEDKKSVTLSVTGLDYGKEYSVTAKDILVGGATVEIASAKFTTPEVNELWNLVVETQDSTITADGSDNTPVTFKLVDKTTGQVDENADNVVLKVSTTRGTLASDRITIQDGKAATILTSEFSNKNVSAKIDAQIIEASGDYNELIGKVVGTANVNFKVAEASDVTVKTLISAESNQADRVTLFFDAAVNLTDFVETTEKGALLYNVVTINPTDGSKTYYNATGTATTTPSEYNLTADTAKAVQKLVAGSLTYHAIKDQDSTATVLPSIEVKQGATSYDIQGFKPVAGNANAIEVILADPNTAPGEIDALTDNEKVEIVANITNSLKRVTESKASFVLTDARTPEVTSVKAEGMNKVVVQFSEAVANGKVRFDGQAATDNTLVSGTGTLNKVQVGVFDALTLQDQRSIATITLEDAYTKATYGGPADGYFKAGSHSLQVSNLEDHAAATDSKNVGTTQTLQFSVKDDKSLPTAKANVQSPEQFIVNFDKVLKGDITVLANVANNPAAVPATAGVRLEVFDPETEEWGDVVNTTTIKGETVFTTTQQTITLEHLTGGEYKVEVVEAWKDVLANPNDHYSNYKFRIVVDKGVAVNEANGLANSKTIALDLSYSGSALTKVDNVSPTIKDIKETTNAGEYVVALSEPIKAANLGLSHNGFQVVAPMAVKFQGKDKDGKVVEFAADILGYNDNYDNEVLVKWKPETVGGKTVTPQTIVDAGGSETWTVVATSVSDDIGNTAATLEKNFTIKKTPASAVPFVITSAVKDSATQLTITFSTAIVHTGGLNDVTSLSHYTLNGLALPIGTDIQVADGDGDATNGNEKVIITLPANVLQTTNTITVNKNLLDAKGTKLTGQFEWTLQ